MKTLYFANMNVRTKKGGSRAKGGVRMPDGRREKKSILQSMEKTGVSGGDPLQRPRCGVREAGIDKRQRALWFDIVLSSAREREGVWDAQKRQQVEILSLGWINGAESTR